MPNATIRRGDALKPWLVFRDAETGHYITRGEAWRNPKGTVSERRKPADPLARHAAALALALERLVAATERLALEANSPTADDALAEAHAALAAAGRGAAKP